MANDESLLHKAQIALQDNQVNYVDKEGPDDRHDHKGLG